MKKVTLFCAAGMSTSLLVTKMQEAAKAEGLDYEIAAHSLTESKTYGPESDIILLGPQVKYKLGEIQKQFPEKPVEAIDMMVYGMMDGKKVIERCKEVLGD